MKYIRTKYGIYERNKAFIVKENDVEVVLLGICNDYIERTRGKTWNDGTNVIIKQANTIEELCDEFDIIVPAGIYRFGIYHARYEGWGDFKRAWRDFKEKNGDDYRHYEILGSYGAIWTDKGLIYVAKMNDEGKLELL